MGYRDLKRTVSKVFSRGPAGEDFHDRHKRRLDFNMRSIEWCEEHAAELGLTLRVTNDGHHWQFRGGEIIADWWPSSAKLVIDSRWKNGIHVHDHVRLMQEISNAIERKQQQPRVKKAF